MLLDGFSSTLVFFVNGRKVAERNVEPNVSLVSYLRTTLSLCGTKVGCREGGCGSCTVMLSKYETRKKKIKHWAVTACLVPVASLHGCAVTTVEGIGAGGSTGSPRKLHVLQERLAASHGTQCGFCTPGFLMSMYALLRNNQRPNKRQIQNSIQGNLCRCTGYRPIVEAFNSFSICCQSESQCPCKKEDSCAGQAKPEPESRTLQEPIFPPELMVNPDYEKEALFFDGALSTWYRPSSMKVLLELMSALPDCKLIAGNTELGTRERDKHNGNKLIYVDVTAIQELKETELTSSGMRIGGAVTLSDIEDLCLTWLEEDKCPWRRQTLEQLLKILEWFGNKSIRNAATIGGNIASSSPASDLVPFLVAIKARVTLAKKGGSLSVLMDDDFFLGYRHNLVHRENAVIQEIFVPFSQEDEYLVCYKQSRRQEDDIAIVNAAFLVKVDSTSRKVQECNLAFGGAAATVKAAKQTMNFLQNRVWNDVIVDDVMEFLARDCFLEPNAPGGLVQYRQALIFSLFFKFFQTVKSKLDGVLESQPPSYDLNLTSYQRFLTDVENSPVGVAYPHHSALQHCTGEAVYTDDIPIVQGELFMGLVLSSESHALIKKIDCSAALAVEGIEAAFCAKDFPPELNKTGHVVQDELIFADEKVEYVGQIVAAVVGRSREVAARAAKLVFVEYEKLPSVITIEEAIRQKSFYTLQRMETGDVEKAKDESEVIIEGELRIGGQEHFYLEPQACIVRPRPEHDEIEVFSATQDAKTMQHQVAACLGVPENRVVVRVKRLGGAFGGKESRSATILLPTAMIAKKLNRSVRCVLERDEDMQLTGGRHPFLVKYRVGASKNGRITFLEQNLYSNGGASLDFSASVTRVAVLHSQNAYRIPNARICGYPCKTNLPPNTAFRCFGRPQAMLAAETWMNHLAAELHMDVNQLREMNMLDENDEMCYGQVLTNCNLRRCWDLLLEQSEYYQWQEQIQRFNRQNPWKKRGIAAVPTVFGVGFGRDYMNQASALVLIYTDGSVLLQHGGIEMGQGLHTKMIQVASKELEIDMSMIHITETATDRIPNSSPTAASSSSDLNGAALVHACRKLKQRLDPYRLKNPAGTWKAWVEAAYKDRVSLIATGFYSVTKGTYDPVMNQGEPYNYYSYGAACSQVEIDCLTGDHEVLRTDIVMDVGQSLNPALDIGQIEGAFLQGYGLYTLEELLHAPDGALRTKGPATYKIPTAGNIPRQFNVTLLPEALNPKAIYSSKAIGEPPVFLAASVFFAIRNAIAAARDGDAYFKLDSPLTAERIRLACEDKFTRKAEEVTGGANRIGTWSIRV